MTGTRQMTLELGDFSAVPARRLTGLVSSLLKTPGANSDFMTEPCSELTLSFDGIPDDRHGGRTRLSGGREPWYPRGTEMCNERQISILSAEDLAAIAELMEVPEVRPEWIGGNVVTEGLPKLSLMPPRTRLVFEGGTVIRVDGQNAPCRIAGRSIADHYPDREGLDLLFPKVAARLRGLVGFVERPGQIIAGGQVTAFIPEQWIYDPA